MKKKKIHKQRIDFTCKLTYTGQNKDCWKGPPLASLFDDSRYPDGDPTWSSPEETKHWGSKEEGWEVGGPSVVFRTTSSLTV